MTNDPLNAEEVLTYLHEVADALPATSQQHVVIVVGGALLAWHGLRDATRDVDSVVPVDDEMREAVARVAAMHGLTPRWLNDSAAGFRPRTLDPTDCDAILEHPRLRILAAPLSQVFLMKVLAARESDRPDLVAMWPHLGLSPKAVASEFARAYPAEPHDPYLAPWLEGLAAEAATR